MTWRPGAIAAARVVNAVFFLAISGYCLLSYSPFAYGQFIKPNVVPDLNDFVILAPWLFWLVLLVTALTLLPQLRGARGRGPATAYVAVSSAVGIWMVAAAPLVTIGNTARGFVIGLLALVPPPWLAITDHIAQPPPDLRAADRVRALAACALTALVAWAVYALAVPFRLGQAVGIDLPAGGLAIALGASLVLDLFVFMGILLALLTVMGAADRSRAPAAVEYWLFVSLLALCSALVCDLLVCASIAFTGWDALAASAMVGIAVAAVWADVARLRATHVKAEIAPRLRSGQARSDRRRGAIDSLALFTAPVAGAGSRVVPALVLAALPFIAYGLVSAVSHFDWNFLLQKLGVLVVWLAAFAAVHATLGNKPGTRQHRWLLVAVPLGALVLYGGLGWVESRAGAAPSVSGDVRLNPRVALDRYAAVDPSFRLVRDAQMTRSADTAEYYAYLRSQTLVSPRDVQPLDVDFVRPLGPARARLPHIFLFVIDSMRRDYLSPYNPKATFTPEIGKLASDSFVFERAFTRYAGTGLAVSSIWEGGMSIHMLEQQAFGKRGPLLKLLDANHYLRMMDLDNIVEELVPAEANLVQLNRGKTSMQFDVCTTIDELEARLSADVGGRPVFFYSLPQNVHISLASRRKVPEGESYPGFFAPVASSLRRVDACLGGFIDFLKRTNLYDDSIIILTSDHGDSLGEEGRWGHAYFIQPEVMRVPLIVHLPSRMKAQVAADLAAVTLSTDIAPSLYALLGYEPADRGPLYGRPLFVKPDTDPSRRSRQPFLLASTYGAVYAMLRQNGRRMYVVDAVDGRDYAFDLSSGFLGRRVDVTAAMTAENRQAIRQQLGALAALYHYRQP